jgi:hypothetical protein
LIPYRVEIEDQGRSGNVRYYEKGAPLEFWWEFTMDGAAINVPLPGRWDAWCESSGAGWARGRRAEILQRIGEETKRKRAASAEIEIQDDWIELKF